MIRRLTVWIAALTVGMLMMAVVLAGAAHAQTATGDWNGAVASPTGDLHLGVEIKTEPGGGLSGALASPDQSPAIVALHDVRAEAGRLSFTLPEAQARFDGVWDAGRSAWVGQWTQGGASTPLVLAKGKPAVRPVVAGLDGVWEGSLATATVKLKLALRIATGPYGTLALLDSPDQLTFGMVLSDLAHDGQAVSFRQPLIKAGFTGVLSADGKTLSGTFTQNGASTPLSFARNANAHAALKRPQTPAKPYPYREEEVAFDSAPGVRLGASLTLPPGKGPFPAVVMITGSGPQDRDETLFGHKPFLVIADRLTRNGIAVLRADDRGVAVSTGDFSKATTLDFAADTKAALAFLRTRRDIDPRRIGLIGHSEGGMIAPIVAAEDPKVAFIVLMAGPGAPIHELMTAQRAAVGRSMGTPPALLASNEAMSARIETAVIQAKDQPAAQAAAEKIMIDSGLPPAAAKGQAAQVSSAWYRWFITYDPRPTLAKLRMPVLAIDGDKDTQVVASQNLPAIRQALKADPDVTVVELPGLNHLFQTAETGGPGEYARIEETISPKALDLMTDWIVKHTRR